MHYNEASAKPLLVDERPLTEQRGQEAALVVPSSPYAVPRAARGNRTGCAG
jgi:hypothetical protein